jgi:hypothetical protein
MSAPNNPTAPMPVEERSIAFRYGADARRRGDKLQFSALRNLHPASKQYADFIAGYDSVERAK